jgi:hypothetical protein
MHFVRKVTYWKDYKLILEFEDGVRKLVDLEPHLEGEIFEPLKDLDCFKTVSVNPNLDTIVWPNNTDFSPDFLYQIAQACEDKSLVNT